MFDSSSTNPQPRESAFPPTQWTLIQQAKEECLDAQGALSQLCESYWYPVYAFIRRTGRSAHDAEDLTQEFFARMLRKGYFAEADSDRGRFRSFLLTSVKNFLSDAYRKATADKRGGYQTVLSIDQELAEKRFHNEPATDLAADDLFQRQWDEALLEKTYENLRAEYETQGKAPVYDALKVYLPWNAEAAPQHEVAAQLGLKAATVRSEIFQMRRRYAAVLRTSIAATVGSHGDVEDEIQEL